MRLSSAIASSAIALVLLTLAASCDRAATAPASPEPSADSRPAGPRPVATTTPTAAPAAPEADPFVLVVLGDSFASGDDLPSDAVFSTQLARELADHGVDAEVRDASAAGDAASGLARLDATADADGVVIALGADDLAGAEPASEVQAALAGVIERAQARGLWVGLVGVEAPLGGVETADPIYAEDFNAIYDALARSYRVELYPDYFSGLVDYETGETRPELFLPDGVHPSDLGVAVIADGIADWLADALPRQAHGG